MSDYSFETLNDKEFEILIRDLLSSEFNKRIERFKSGKDGGVDGRFYIDSDNEVIIQCKHWPKSSLNTLLNRLEREEKKKVNKLIPKKYIFVTSRQLSRNNKSKIKDIFSPHIKSESDIFGNEDLNDLIKKYPEVEKQHYKLWLFSTNVLQQILHSGIYGRSNYQIEEFQRDASKYVITDNHENAIDKLNQLHSIIITGSPGIGKTTLAEQLCLYYISNEFNFFCISNSIKEAESIYDIEKKQIFYFDDFLGRNFLSAIENKKDSEVLNFIKRISHDDNKRFILTSRTNILNQGKKVSELFKIYNSNKNEYEIKMKSLSKLDKAKILYNHIWFSTLQEEYIEEIYKNKRYKKIIDHQNYNPRLISYITDSFKIQSVYVDDYWDYIENTLDNPKDVWKHVFDVEIDTESKHIVIGITLHGRSISERQLLGLINRLKKSELNFNKDRSNDSLIRVLVGALINRSINEEKEIKYNLFDPSIGDYVLSNCFDDLSYICEILLCLQTDNSLEHLANQQMFGNLSSRVYHEIIIKMIDKHNFLRNYDFENKYFRKLVLIYIKFRVKAENSLAIIKSAINEYIKNITAPLDYDQLSFIDECLESNMIKKDNCRLEKIIIDALQNDDYERYELLRLGSIINKSAFSSNHNEIIIDKIKKYLIDTITDDVIEDDVQGDVYEEIDYDEEDVYKYIEGIFNDYDLAYRKEDIEYLLSFVEPYRIAEHNRESMDPFDMYEGGGRGRGTAEYATEIDDLFDRS
ncbi:MAG: restriction endonuclease [Saprospiraceae bacterium]|nr:restriction endonuclease [Saprospiraceae bacterium]